MAKKKKPELETLTKTVPHVIAFLVLAALFLASVRIVQIAVGMGGY